MKTTAFFIFKFIPSCKTLKHKNRVNVSISLFKFYKQHRTGQKYILEKDLNTMLISSHSLFL